MSGVVVSAPPGSNSHSNSYSSDRVPDQSLLFPSSAAVPPRTQHSASALADEISMLSISPRTPLPPHFRTRAQSSTVVPAIRGSSETDDRSSLTNDVIIRNGWLMKRGRRWSWARRWFVLRPTHITYYKDDTEYKASEIIPISEISTAAILSEQPKKKTHFGIFTSSRNFHLQADSASEADLWVSDIKTAIRLNEQQSEFSHGASSTVFRAPNFRAGAESARSNENVAQMPPPSQLLQASVATSSIPETESAEEPQGPLNKQREHLHRLSTSQARPIATGSHRHSLSMHVADTESPVSSSAFDRGARSPDPNAYNGSTYEFSGTEDAFSSGASDYGVPISSSALRNASDIELSSQTGQTTITAADTNLVHDLAQLEKDRVLHCGHLLQLMKRYKKWRRKWVVLRRGSLAFYKSQAEYKPLKIVPLEKLIDVMEIDSMSRSKQYCMQVILPEKRIRLCAENEEDLTGWLVALKAAMAHSQKDHEENNKSGL